MHRSFNFSIPMVPRTMRKWILSLLLLLICTISTTRLATSWSDYDEFFEKCPPSSCSKDGPEVRFPYRLSNSSSSCGAAGMVLSCSGLETILQLPNNVGPCKVLEIDYSVGYITVELGQKFSPCAYQKLASVNLTSAVYQPPKISWPTSMNLISCSKDMVNKSSEPFTYIDGPVECLSSSSQLAYFLDFGYSLDDIPSFCTFLQNNISLPFTYGKRISNNSLYASLTWFVPGITKRCIACESADKYCASTKSFCPNHRKNMKLIGAISSTTLVVFLFLVAVPCYYISRRSTRKDHLRQEELLAIYSKTATRYTFSEIKKMTKQFKEKLGQGGYGSVFKGELPDGIHAAVKVLNKPNTSSDGRDFINEVSTIGTTHHFNVVRLLGFCSEGSNRALVYEFMPNGSLDKYISHSRCNDGEMPQMEVLLKIVSGVASGIKYLHEGCIQRILHFDIKPHNILLDHNLNPKIADFGLAKLCSKDRSDVTVTAAKGTIGYMAPEVYSRNFGNVSYKSDVYSFGMLILKMVVGEKNLIPDLESNSEVYYPELIYEKLIKGEDLVYAFEIKPTEIEIQKRLIIVAFWCIQWNPEERPNMARVVQMLGSNLQNLEIPPKPFVS